MEKSQKSFKYKTLELIKNSKAIIWDFDGVIKDSVNLKGEAFNKLFEDQKIDIKNKIYKHHNTNSGLSRFKKLHKYLDWSSHENNIKNLNLFAKKFSDLVVKEVINANYIEGIENYLKENHNRQKFFLVTATPESEILNITKKLEIYDYFEIIIGYPKTKEEGFKLILNESSIGNADFIVIGDSLSEYNAAKKYSLKFVLRIDKSKRKIPEWYIERDLTINNFISE